MPGYRRAGNRATNVSHMTVAINCRLAAYNVGKGKSMPTPATTPEISSPVSRLGPRELRRMPAAEREVILIAAARQAESEYRTNSNLTAFEAFSKDDLHGESADTQTR